MNKPPRLLLALAVTGLASAAAADGGAPPVLANAALDALTANTVLPSEAYPAAAGGGAADASGWAEDGHRRPAEWLTRRSGLPRDGIGDGRGPSAEAPASPSAAGEVGPGGGGVASAYASPSGAGAEGGSSASAAGSVIGGSISRSVVANSPGSAATASATASGPGLSAVSAAAQSGPGFSSSISRSTAVTSR